MSCWEEESSPALQCFVRDALRPLSLLSKILRAYGRKVSKYVHDEFNTTHVCVSLSVASP